MKPLEKKRVSTIVREYNLPLAIRKTRLRSSLFTFYMKLKTAIQSNVGLEPKNTDRTATSVLYFDTGNFD